MKRKSLIKNGSQKANMLIMLLILTLVLSGCNRPDQRPLAENTYQSALDVVPSYNLASAESIILAGNSAAFTTNYYHSAAYVGVPAEEGSADRDGKYYICLDPPEMKSGSKFQIYGLTDQGMILQENHYFQGSITALGRTYTPRFGHAVYNGNAYITYHPYNDENNQNVFLEDFFYDAQFGNTLAMLSLQHPATNETCNTYPVLVNLTTEEVTDFLQQLNPSVADKAVQEGIQLVACRDAQYLFQIGVQHYYYNYSQQKLTEIKNITESTQSELSAYGKVAWTLASGTESLLFCFSDEYSDAYFLCDGATGSLVKVPTYAEESVATCMLVEDMLICAGKESIWFVDVKTKEVTALLQNIHVIYGCDAADEECTSFIIYTDDAGSSCVYDFISRKTFHLANTGNWSAQNTGGYIASPDGRKLLLYRADETHVIQFAILDCDSRTWLDVTRSNPNAVEECRIWWQGNEAIAVASDDLRECYVYSLTQQLQTQ